MKTLANMPASGVIVIAVIAVLFILAVMLLFYVRLRYRFLEGKARVIVLFNEHGPAMCKTQLFQ